jgi:hypothetical protein
MAALGAAAGVSGGVLVEGVCVVDDVEVVEPETA